MICKARLSLIRFLLGGLLAFGALNAIAGGFYGISGAEGVPLELLEGSPFTSYYIPSLILLVVVGGSFLFASIALFTDSRIARVSTLTAGAIVLIWIIVQVTIIGYMSWMQPVTAVSGILILLLAWLLPGPCASSQDTNYSKTT